MCFSWPGVLVQPKRDHGAEISGVRVAQGEESQGSHGTHGWRSQDRTIWIREEVYPRERFQAPVRWLLHTHIEDCPSQRVYNPQMDKTDKGWVGGETEAQNETMTGPKVSSRSGNGTQAS